MGKDARISDEAARRAAPRSMRMPNSRRVLPNLFIVGAPKCGTTSLHHHLGQHPNVYMSPVKEPRFWSDDLRAQGRAFHAALSRRSLRSVRGILTLPYCLWIRRRILRGGLLGIESFDRYLALFEAADPEVHRYIGEASTDSMWSRTAAARIAHHCPDSRIIIMLRDPLAYIPSIHRESLSGAIGETIPSLRQALDLEPLRRQGAALPCTVRYPYSVLYRDQAHFDEQVDRFLDCFGRDRLHFVLLEDLADDARAALRGVLAFLGLPDAIGAIDMTPRNTAPERRRLTLDEALRVRLMEEFRPVVRRLQQQTGLPLIRRWRYE